MIQEQVIAVLSHKFSGAATRWPTIEQEACAIFFGVKKLEKSKLKFHGDCLTFLK